MQRLGDGQSHTVRIAKDIVVPEAKNSISFGGNHPIAMPIPIGAVLTTIRFDHQTRTMAGKVSKEMSNRNLAPKAPFGKAIAEQVPKTQLGIGRIPP